MNLKNILDDTLNPIIEWKDVEDLNIAKMLEYTVHAASATTPPDPSVIFSDEKIQEMIDNLISRVNDNLPKVQANAVKAQVSTLFKNELIRFFKSSNDPQVLANAAHRLTAEINRLAF